MMDYEERTANMEPIVRPPVSSTKFRAGKEQNGPHGSHIENRTESSLEQLRVSVAKSGMGPAADTPTYARKPFT